MPDGDITERYKQRLRQELGPGGIDETVPVGSQQIVSEEYQEFRKRFLPKKMGWYEKACQLSEQLLHLKPDEKRTAELLDAIRIIHLEVTPSGTLSFAMLAPITLLFIGGLVAFLVFQSMFMAMAFGVGALGLVYPFQNLPDFLANNWRLKASNQMVQCIFYVVTYMRHTSNIERAVKFASEHLGPPLSLDLQKVMWDVATGEYESVKDSLDAYLETWKKWNPEFIESFHLVVGSLYESSEERRLDVLDKSLTVILTETYEKMLRYAHDLQGPVTMLHMMGVILPILGLVILPLVVSFMAGENTTPTSLALYIGTLYNFLLPAGVYVLGKVILTKRPTGYGESSEEDNPELARLKNKVVIGKTELPISPLAVAWIVFGVLFFIGVSPLVLHLLNPGFEIPSREDEAADRTYEFLGYICPKATECSLDKTIGPYGIGASLLSLAVTLSLGLSVGIYYSLRSSNVFEIRERTKKLEGEFAAALFQLGNRLGDGLPAEIAFARVAEVTTGQATGEFFTLVNYNITKLGMSVEDAIFNPRNGALVMFPSNVIKSSMKVLVESSRKGPKIAAQALISMSNYIKEIHRVDERLKDLLADIIASMKGQIRFLTPAIAGIVIGITSMITTILNKLSKQIATLTKEGGTETAGGIGGIVSLFGDGVPTYYFQIVVGIYVVQITYILTVLGNGIENGSDKLNEHYLLGKYMISSTVLYCVISLIVMLLFNVVAGSIMARTMGG